MNRTIVLKRFRTALLWAGAIGFGVLGVFGTRGYIADSLESERQRLAQAQQTVATVVAKRELAAGDPIDAGSLAVRQMPVKFLPDSAVLADEFEEVLGSRLLVPMTAGQSLLRTSITAHEQGFSDQVGHGIRAMTVVVDEVNSVSGMLTPGDRIDLLFSTRPPDNTGEATEVTAPLMQDLLVLATGTKTSRNDDPVDAFATITVEVTPDQAQRLVLAQHSGRLTALLRNPKDRRAHQVRPMDVYGLLGMQRPGSAAVGAIGPQVIVGGLGPLKIKNGAIQVAK